MRRINRPNQKKRKVVGSETFSKTENIKVVLKKKKFFYLGFLSQTFMNHSTAGEFHESVN